MTAPLTLHLGELWDVHPVQGGAAAAGPPDAGATLRAVPGGALAVDAAGRIAARGPAADLRRRFPGAAEADHGDALLLPGFVDGHLHFPQLDIIGSYGEQLLGWLNRYTFPAEARFADPELARATAERLATELLANGTTCAMIFGSTHAAAAEALFGVAEARGLRAIVGKVGMDRHAPPGVLQDADGDAADNERLIARWHGAAGGRLRYALTPRFVPTCSEALLANHGVLAARHPDVHVQTHWAENPAEIAWVRALCPADRDYLAVYERHGLLGPRTVLAHALHVDDAMLARVAAAGAALAHCPTSNLFLGSGLFPLDRARAAGCRVVLGTDIGGGTSLSPWRTLDEAYKVQQLRGHAVPPAQWLHLATLGGAEALGLGAEIGNFELGKWADFQVLDWRRHRLLAHRFGQPALTADEKLFALIMLGDDRLTARVYVAGREVFAA